MRGCNQGPGALKTPGSLQHPRSRTLSCSRALNLEGQLASSSGIGTSGDTVSKAGNETHCPVDKAVDDGWVLGGQGSQCPLLTSHLWQQRASENDTESLGWRPSREEHVVPRQGRV